MLIKLDPGFTDRLRGRFSKFEFQVGILEDGPHKLPKRGQRGLKGEDVKGAFAGGPVRKTSTKDSGKSISEVSKDMRERLGFNYLTEPFKRRTPARVLFTNEFLKLAFDRSQKKRVENLIQAVVRNPILRREYGANSALTKKIKGFDRFMIDTAQLFKSIKAFCKVRSNV